MHGKHTTNLRFQLRHESGGLRGNSLTTRYNQSMKQARVLQAEEEVERQKSSHFRGRARVPLQFLHFSEHNPRDLDQSNVRRLIGVYAEEGVKRLQYEHYVPAVIGKDDLSSALQLSGLSLVDLLNSSQSKPPRLTFPEGFRLTCLHGKHRIEAAKHSSSLQGDHRWWTVTLYSEGTPYATCIYNTSMS